ncbi:MAG: helix-turn-helix domain-containing protein [Candidatus Methanoperedens sp.]|nr:helix-turn-helix domain-containing protein [Candidatus Methanoperedens sp.]CAG1009953.1 hypothetical protein METP1_03800 [Methanosarcinales archaeon]
MSSKTNNNVVFIQLLADEYSRAIMARTSIKEYSALQLSRELDIPHTTVYRKLKILEYAKLIQTVRTVIDRVGNEEKYYRCTVREATVKFKGGDVLISVEKLDYKDKFVMLWKMLSKPES